MTPPLKLDPATTALVLIDLQTFAVDAPLHPITGRSVLANAVKLANTCREKGICVVLVRVATEHGAALRPRRLIDVAMPDIFKYGPDAFDFPSELGPRPGDAVVSKYTIGAFFGTDLELHLRRRGIRTVVIGGLVTNFGVEATLRDAYDYGYALVAAGDAMSAFSAPEHDFALQYVFPRLACVRTTAQILDALR